MKTAFPYRYLLELPTFEYGCLIELNIKKGTRERQGKLMSNQCLICHCRYDVEELPMPGSSNLMAEHKVLYYKYQGKIRYVLFSSIKSKRKSKFLQNHRGTGEGAGGLFCGKIRFLLPKIILTH